MQHGKRGRLPQLRALVLAVQAACGCSVWALPQGAAVVNGQVSISQPATGSLKVQASNGAIINWKQFSIGAGETTQFVQPSANSAVLNRVVGADASLLLGQLSANGQVFLINPHGIVIGSGARIDTNSFIASTLDIADADFLAGKLRFLAGSGAGRIRNDGAITAGPGGSIALIAPDVENNGIIQAPDGQILLAAGRKLEIASMDLEGVTFEIQAPTDSVLNLGKLLAENGAVRAFAGTLRHSGMIQANRLVQDSDGSIVLAGSNSVTLTSDSETRAEGGSGGNILIQSAQGTTRVAGQVSAVGSAGSGGDIRMLGERVAVESGARIDASGATGGGQILIGGDFQGKNLMVQNAERTFVGAGAQLKADATANGDGGRVIVWADENTRYYGNLSAQGGPLGGNGGFAEVSGKSNLEFSGTANLGAPAGSNGSLLLDPLDIIVSLTSGILPIVVDEFADFASNVVTVSPVALAAVAGQVTLQAERDIYIKDTLALTAGGAGLTATAGGAAFNAGTIYNNAGITTAAGPVTLRAQGIEGAGGINTSGGAVDLLTSGSLNYSGAINSGGGAVMLASQSSSVNYANVNAGGGAINVTGQTGVSNGSYTTTGTINLTANSGGLSVYSISAGIANLTANGSINAQVDVSDRVNANSSGSYVQIYGDGAGPLRLGTLSGNTGLYLHSSNGMAQAAGGLLTAPFVNLYTDNSSVSSGTVAAPLLIASPSGLVQPEVTVYDLAAPVHLGFSGAPTLGGLSLEGTVAALAASTVTGAANLTSLTLGAGTGVLNLSAVSTGGFASGLELNVVDGGINATTLTLPGGAVDLSANGPVTVGSMTGGSLSVEAIGAVNIGTATTTGNSGIYVYTNKCYYYAYVACADNSPISATTLSAGGTGDIVLYTYDNGNVAVGSLTAGGDVTIQAGRNYPTSYGYPYTNQRTSNNIILGTVVSAGGFYATNDGQGDITVTSLGAGNSVEVQAGGTFSPVTYLVSQRTANNITIGNTETVAAAGSFEITNSGIGNINLSGNVDRTQSGDVNLYATDGSVTSTGNLAAYYSIDVTAGTGAVNLANLSSTYYGVSASAGTTLTVGQVSAGSAGAYGGVDLSAGGNLSFDSLTSTGYSSSYGHVSLVSASGTVKTINQVARLDVTATGDVAITANDGVNGFIGDAAFAHPMDIKAGAGNMVTLSAGKDIGATAKPVLVDTAGGLAVTSIDGQFHVAATDGVTAKSLSTIRLSASASGIGNGGTSTFTSADLNVSAGSDGSVITIGDLVRSTGTLNEFSFIASGASGLTFGDVNLTTAAGINKLVLMSNGPLLQSTGNIVAGNLSLDAGAGDVLVGNVTSSSAVIASPGANNILRISGANILAGNLSAEAIDINGSGDVALGSVTSTGTNRGYGWSSYDYAAGLYPLDELKVMAGGNLATAGDISSATSAFVTAGANLIVNAGAGSVTAGTTYNGYYTDTAKVWAGTGTGNMLSAADISGYRVDLQGDMVQVGDLTANSRIIVSGNAIGTGTIQANDVELSGASFATGNVTATNTLVVTSSAGYAPLGVALTAGFATIIADGDIDIASANASSLTAPTVQLTSTAGNVKAELTNTSDLRINTAVGFNVSSDTWLGNLNVTAQWDMATGDPGTVGASVSSNPVSGGQSFGYSFDGQLYLNASSFLAAGRAWDLVYHDVSPNPVVASPTPSAFDFVDASVSHASAGTFNILFDSSTRMEVGASIGSTVLASSTPAHLAVTTGGDLRFSNVVTNGGNLSGTSSNGNITFGTIDTSAEGFAGNVSLNTFDGSIELDSSLTHLISTASYCSSCIAPLTVPYGTVNLGASAGSVGGVATLPLSYVAELNVAALNKIDIDASVGNLTGLYLATHGSGSGTISVANPNFTGLSITRNAGNLELSGLNPVVSSNFYLTAKDGNIAVTGDIDNVYALLLNAGRGYNSVSDLVIQAGSGARTISANSYDLLAGRDVLISAGAASGDNVSIAGTGAGFYSNVRADRDILVSGNGGSALLSHLGSISTTQTLEAGRDLRVVGGSAGITGASAAIVSTQGIQAINVGGDLVIQAGSTDGASAKIEAFQYQSTSGINNLSVVGGGNNASAQLLGWNQIFNPIYGSVTVQGGGGTNAFAEVVAAGFQQYVGSTYYATDAISVQGGGGSGSYASIRSANSQWVYSSENISVLAGTGSGSNAEIKAGGQQVVGSAYTYFSDPTADILVQASAGGTARILAGGNQTVEGGGNISVLGGPSAGMTALIETTGGSQSIGTSSTYFYDPTGNILIQGGLGSGAFALVKASGSQSVNAGGAISVLGNSGAGAFGEILSTGGGQQIGSSSNNYNDPTDSILVQAGSGGIAKVYAQGSQTIMTGGDLSVIAGNAANMTAAIESAGGSQSIGNTYIYSNDPSGSVLVQAGNAPGASAWIRASTGQSIDAGGTITLTGGVANAFAELSTTTGSQNIGNVNLYYYDQTDNISLTGGTAGSAYAKIESGGTQAVSSSGSISLAAGSGDDSGAGLVASTGQQVTAYGTLSILGGSGATAGGNETGIRNNISGTQTIYVNGDITVTGGATGSATGIANEGTGFQSITSTSGSLIVIAPAGSPNTDGAVGVESGTGGQSIQVANGSITVNNEAALAAYIRSDGNQSITARSLSVSQSSPYSSLTGPLAVVTASGDQSITLNGDGVTAGSATLSVVNLSGPATSTAAVSAGGNQVILMNYDAAGLVTIGDVAALGPSMISAGGDHTMVAGQLLIHGGANSNANSILQAGSTATMRISTLFGPVELKGGSDGGAYIDPALLEIVSNGSVLLQAGANSTANANINADVFNLAATTGDLNLVNSTSSPATASITANSFSFAGPGNVNLTGGTITVSTGGTIDIAGLCNGCDTNLIGPFSVTAYVPPPTDFASLVAGEILTITDAAGGVFDVYVDEDGNLVLTTRRLNQCY